MKFLQDSVHQKSPQIGWILTELFKKYEVDIFRDTVCSSLADTHQNKTKKMVQNDQYSSQYYDIDNKYSLSYKSNNEGTNDTSTESINQSIMYFRVV